MWGRIPVEIIREHIMPYAYEIQPKELCEDIRDFVCTKKYLMKLYRIRHYNGWNHLEDIQWLTNDVSLYMNGLQPTMYFGYIDKYINYFRRLYKLQEVDEEAQIIRELIDRLNAVDLQREINIKLGVMYPSEREELCTYLDQLNLI